MVLEEIKHLAVKAQKGDQKAYKSFLEEVYLYILKRCSKKIFYKDDREDVAQEILVSIHRGLNTFNPEKKITPWINAIIEFRSIDYFRKKSSIQSKEVQASEDEVTNLKAISNTQYEMIDLINSLPKKYSRPILLTKVYGHSTREASLIMNIKENALRTRLSRAIKELRTLMEEIENE